MLEKEAHDIRFGLFFEMIASFPFFCSGYWMLLHDLNPWFFEASAKGSFHSFWNRCTNLFSNIFYTDENRREVLIQATIDAYQHHLQAHNWRRFTAAEAHRKAHWASPFNILTSTTKNPNTVTRIKNPLPNTDFSSSLMLLCQENRNTVRPTSAETPTCSTLYGSEVYVHVDLTVVGLTTLGPHVNLTVVVLTTVRSTCGPYCRRTYDGKVHMLTSRS